MYHLANIPVSTVGPISPDETNESLTLDIINNEKLVIQSDITKNTYNIWTHDPALPIMSCLVRDNDKEWYDYSFQLNCNYSITINRLHALLSLHLSMHICIGIYMYI